ncbi:MAG: helix-turn-helix domain-containing protein, partial [Pseudomonadota bacterium]
LQNSNASIEQGETLRDRVDAYEILLIKQALAQCHGDMSQAAILLNIPRRTLDEKIARFGIERESFRNH